ncbi:hypothetical protein D3C78_1353710 [compost metagenome]
MPGVRGVEHALEAEQDVVGVQGAAGLEVAGAVELHLGAQLELVDQAIGRNRPAFGQAWHHLAFGGIELDQAVHQHIGRGIGGGQRVVLNHIEAFWAGFGTHTQRGRLGECRAEQGGEQQG